MKNLLFISVIAMVTLISCGHKSEKDMEKDDGIYHAPLKVTAIHEYNERGWEYYTEYTYNIGKNGRLSGSRTFKTRGSFNRDQNPWDKVEGKTEEFGGKWSKSSISMGDGRLEVFCLDPSYSSATKYLPATCEYIWMCDNAWYYCENWDTSRALKVQSVEQL